MTSDTQQELPAKERIEEIANILSKGIIRYLQAQNRAAKKDLLQPTLQSESCTNEREV